MEENLRSRCTKDLCSPCIGEQAYYHSEQAGKQDNHPNPHMNALIRNQQQAYHSPEEQYSTGDDRYYCASSLNMPLGIVKKLITALIRHVFLFVSEEPSEVTVKEDVESISVDRREGY